MTIQSTGMPGAESDLAGIRLMHEGLASLHLASAGTPAEIAGGVFVHDGKMALSLAANLPKSAIVLNHGFITPDIATLSRAASIYRERGVARFFLSSAQDIPAEVLNAAGMAPARAWRLFQKSLAEPGPERSDRVTIHQVQSGAAEDFAAIVSEAFDLGEAARPFLARLPDAEGWHGFQADIEGPAGGGALFVSDGYAWTDFGATAPQHRCQGVQQALLAHRINSARDLGCHTILTCTGEAVPGEAQISYRNILKSGFREAGLLFNYAPR